MTSASNTTGILLSLGLLALGVAPAHAVAPCAADPCADLGSSACQQAAGRVVDAELVGIQYRSVEVPYPDRTHSGVFQTVPTALTFLALAPPGSPASTPRREWRLVPASRCWPMPGLAEMRPKKLRLAVRTRPAGDWLVHFEVLP